jgi:hypothetical protein
MMDYRVLEGDLLVLQACMHSQGGCVWARDVMEDRVLEGGLLISQARISMVGLFV